MPSTVTDRLAGLSTSVAVKAPCRVATTAAITLSGTQTIDGVAVVANDRVLVKNQTNAAQNGIYYVSTTSWDRAEDLDSGDDIVNGTTVFITEGNDNGSNWFQATLGDYPAVIGTDTITWAEVYVSLTPVSAATETASGIAEIATQAEVDTGTDDARFVTPLKLKTELQATAYDTGVVSTDAGAGEGPTDELYRNSASPAAADLAGVRSWAGKSSTGVKRVLAKLLVLYDTVTNAAESASLVFQTIRSGALATRMTISNGLFMAGATGGDQGAGTINASNFYKNGVLLASKLAGFTSSVNTTYTTCSTAIPDDNTVPQNTEGDQILSVSYTPTNTNSSLEIEVNGMGYNGAAVNATVALFQDSVANAIAATQFGSNTSTYFKSFYLRHVMTAGTTSAITFNVRLGPASGSVYLNGTNTTRSMGGVSGATITVKEYLP